MRTLRLFVLFLLLALLATSCRDDDATDVTLGRSDAATTSTSLVTTPPSPPTSQETTEAPTSTTPSQAGPVVARAVLSPRGVVVPVVEPVGAGWRVRTPCSATAALGGGSAIASATVVLDPGHGGREPGAVSPGGMSEAPINLEVARHARTALEAAGVSTVLTRTGDYDVDLPTRAEIAKALSPQAFVSIHHNAEPDGPWPRPGTETYYQIGSPDSKRLAGLLYEEIITALSAYPGEWVADRDAGAKYRRGSRGDYYAMLRLPSPVVSALSEAAFISNPPEAALLARADVQEAEGRAIARALLRYLKTNDPGSGFTEPYPRPDPPGGGAPPPCRETPL